MQREAVINSVSPLLSFGCHRVSGETDRERLNDSVWCGEEPPAAASQSYMLTALGGMKRWTGPLRARPKSLCHYGMKISVESIVNSSEQHGRAKRGIRWKENVLYKSQIQPSKLLSFGNNQLRSLWMSLSPGFWFLRSYSSGTKKPN